MRFDPVFTKNLGLSHNLSTSLKKKDEEKKEKSVFQDTQMEILNAIKKLGSRIDKLETRNSQKSRSQRDRSSRMDWRKSDQEDEDW